MVTINLLQEKTVSIIEPKTVTSATLNVYGVTDNLQDSIIADVDFGTSDSRMQIVLWTGTEYAALTTFSKGDAQAKLLSVIAAM